jgi:hypothetical protein
MKTAPLYTHNSHNVKGEIKMRGLFRSILGIIKGIFERLVSRILEAILDQLRTEVVNVSASLEAV